MEEFIQQVEHRSKMIKEGGDDKQIPVIDLSSLQNDPCALLMEIQEACSNWGFFQVVNHGVPASVLQAMNSASRYFFSLYSKEKMKVRRDEINPMGYYDTEYTKNVRDWKEIFDFAQKSPVPVPVPAASYHHENTGSCNSGDMDHGYEITMMTNQWPDCYEFRVACEDYARETEKLCYKLLELISLSLGLPGDRFNSFFKDQMTLVRLNHYPPCPEPQLALGLGRHKDNDAFTILCQLDDVEGLEVKRRSDGEWVGVRALPDAFVINIGDVFQVWSNDQYQSVEHRVVVNTQRERYSVGYFFVPGHTAIIEPMKELVDDSNPAKYKAFNWGKFIRTKLSSNFKKLNVEDLDIGHFRVPKT